MLIEIKCDIFRQKEITFKTGLNVITGDNKGSNSIGKTLTLMIIDFVFGGESYITKHESTITELGHHEFRFKFRFDNQYFYFIRNTNTPKSISICDEEYNIVTNLTLQKYLQFLQDKYNCNLYGTTFRGIISRYMRIYGKGNLNEMAPLDAITKSKTKDSVQDIIKLFNYYETLYIQSHKVENLKEIKDTLNKAGKNGLISKAKNIEEIKYNIKKIISLREEYKNITQDIPINIEEIEALFTKEVLELKDSRYNLIIELNELESQFERLQTNFSQLPRHTKKELQNFTLYFPNFNVEKIAEIELFHKMLNKDLSSTYTETLNEIEDKINQIKSKISTIEHKLNGLVSKKLGHDELFERAGEIKIRIQKLEEANKLYEDELNIKKQLVQAKKEREELYQKALNEISNLVNNTLADLNGKFNNASQNFANLKFNSSTKYTFNTTKDKGTGTAFKNLILLDLSILSLTKLPCICHDLPIIKNIEDETMIELIKLYSNYEKQIFLVIDKVDSYHNNDMTSIVNKNTVLNLSEENTLFNIVW